MRDLFQFFRHEPVLSGIALICFLLVGSVVLSDWRDKRRTRKLLKLRDELKSSNRRSVQQPISRSTERTGFRIFRWEFVVLSVICVCIWVPFSKKNALPIQAKSLPQEQQPAAPTENAEPESKSVSVSEPLLSFHLSTPKVASGRMRLHLSDSDIASAGTEARSPFSLLGALQKNATTGNVDLTSLFQEDNDAEQLTELAQNNTLSARDMYSAGDQGFTPNDPRKRLRFGKR